MTRRPNISTFISRLTISVLLLLGSTGLQAQGFLKYQQDTIPLFRGFAVSFDLVGAAESLLSDKGEYEAALRLNLHDQYFPIVELGYGHANHDYDDVTKIKYSTAAPYFRVGVDVNVMKKKHTGNRIFVGLRYAFTSYKVDLYSEPVEDPVWKWKTAYDITGEQCSMHWGEAVFGLDAKVLGPLHLGWSVRYRFRLSHNDGVMGNTWYVPGYGKQDTSSLGATFNVIFDI